MRLCFSTLACPEWKIEQAIQLAADCEYDGIELRFVESEDSLWKLPAFQGDGLEVTKQRLADQGLKIPCVDTSCRFDSPDADERAHRMSEGVRMAELAAELNSPGIRVFGDKVQPGEDREATRAWITDSIAELAHAIQNLGVEVWLETHGDFVSPAETMSTVAGCENAGVIWDPANALADDDEAPTPVARAFGNKLRHVHLKDFDFVDGKFKPVLTGKGRFPFDEVLRELAQIRYDGFISFEWEKKWYPEIAGVEIAVPQFARWIRQRIEVV